jgi:ubiquinol-cytochrome c reductase iron-sulfur subunit
MDKKGDALPKEEKDISRRDFVVMTASAAACAGAVAAVIPFVKSLSPDAGVLAVGTTEVDIANIPEGETVTVMWRGSPVFVRHRTQNEVDEARATEISSLRDPQRDEDRVQSGREKWLITLAVCTHLGCVPLSNKGDFGGWLCPCHGSHYDTSGRIRKGPAPNNLGVPPYKFLSDTKIIIG